MAGAGQHTSRWLFRRGSVESAAVEVGRFLAVGEEIFRSWPIRHLRFQAPLAGHADDEAVRQLTRSKLLARLERLTVHCDDSLTPAGAGALAACPTWPTSASWT